MKILEIFVKTRNATLALVPRRRFSLPSLRSLRRFLVVGFALAFAPLLQPFRLTLSSPPLPLFLRVEGLAFGTLEISRTSG